MRASPLTRLRQLTTWILLAPVIIVWMLLVLLAAGHGARGVATIALVTVLAVATARLMLRAIGAVRARGEPLELVAGLVAAAAAFALVRQYGQQPAALLWSMLAGLLVVAIALRLPQGRRVAVTMAGMGLILLAQWMSGHAISVSVLMAGSALLAAGSAGMQWWTYEVAQRLEEARTLAAELAIAEERLRFAAELHDIQGHHLQVIALKSELAARVGDRDKAVALMREVQQLARDALTDTRAVVGGYRQVSLGTELANAVKVLTAAGVRATTEATAEPPAEATTAGKAAARTRGEAEGEAADKAGRRAGGGPADKVGRRAGDRAWGKAEARDGIRAGSGGREGGGGRVEGRDEISVGGATGRLLGLVAREATTNILRHAQATTATLRLAVQGDQVSLTIVNDGADLAGGKPRTPTEQAASGSGLRTLAERVAAAGGRLSWSSAQGEFVVAATLPIEETS